MSRNKTQNTADLSALLTPQNELMLAVEQAMLRDYERPHAATPVAEQIAVRLASIITLNLIQAGQRLLEADLSEVLHVSRAPVREALRILERDRLVEFEPRRGVIVAAPDRSELRDIYVVRGALYAILLRQLMQDCPGDLDAVLERHLPKLTRAAQESVDAYAVAGFLLNLEMTRLCSNRMVVDLLTSISLRTLRYVRLGLGADPARIPASLRTWKALHRAVVKRDLDLVLTTADRRIQGSRDAALRAIEPAAGISRKTGPGRARARPEEPSLQS